MRDRRRVQGCRASVSPPAAGPRSPARRARRAPACYGRRAI
jgi:hypothetical protein